jgi:hypothetical protein
VNGEAEWLELTPEVLRCAGSVVAIVRVDKREPNALDVLFSRPHAELGMCAEHFASATIELVNGSFTFTVRPVPRYEGMFRVCEVTRRTMAPLTMRFRSDEQILETCRRSLEGGPPVPNSPLGPQLTAALLRGDQHVHDG